MQISHGAEENSAAGVDRDAVHSSLNQASENVMVPTDIPSSDTKIPGMGNVSVPVSSDVQDVSNLESGIPGLDSFARNDTLSETVAASSLASSDVEEASQEQVTSLVQRSPLNLVSSISTDRSEEISPKAAVTDVNSVISSTATSDRLSSRLVLPKMTAPVVDLADEQKDNLQRLAFMRIIDAYKQIAVAGGSKVRFSILAYLGVEVTILSFQVSFVSLFIYFLYNLG